MKYKSVFSVIIFVLIISIAGCAKTKGLNTVIAMRQDEIAKQTAVDRETENYQRLKASIGNNDLKLGITQRAVLGKYGKPVLIFSEDSAEKWVYKPAQASWFGGEKIYLYFDFRGELVKWEEVEVEK